LLSARGNYIVINLAEPTANWITISSAVGVGIQAVARRLTSGCIAVWRRISLCKCNEAGFAGAAHCINTGKVHGGAFLYTHECRNKQFSVQEYIFHLRQTFCRLQRSKFKLGSASLEERSNFLNLARFVWPLKMPPASVTNTRALSLIKLLHLECRLNASRSSRIKQNLTS
jgi:hypothetical protein